MRRFGAQRGRTTWLLKIASAVAIALASASALAAPSASDKDAARELMAQGRKERAAGHQAAALERFQAADRIMQVPTTGLEVGQSFADLGKLVEARDAWLAVTKLPVEPKEPEAFVKARQRAQELVDEITPRIPTAKFDVSGQAQGSTLKVTLDEASIEADTLVVPRRLNPGKHVAVFNDGTRTRKIAFELAERDTKEIEVDLASGDEDSSAATTTTTSTTSTTATEPPPPTDVDTGKGSPLRAPFLYGGFGLAGAGLIAGGITGFISMQHTSSAKNLCTNNLCPPSTHDDLATARSMATFSNIGFAVAGVGAIVGVVGLLLPSAPVAAAPPPTTGSKPSATVVVGFGSIGDVGSF